MSRLYIPLLTVLGGAGFLPLTVSYSTNFYTQLSYEIHAQIPTIKGYRTTHYQSKAFLKKIIPSSSPYFCFKMFKTVFLIPQHKNSCFGFPFLQTGQPCWDILAFWSKSCLSLAKSMPRMKTWASDVLWLAWVNHESTCCRAQCGCCCCCCCCGVVWILLKLRWDEEYMLAVWRNLAPPRDV